LGWVGFDPTNNLIAAERHIRVAIGRDYADVPPTRGIFKGEAEDELSVGVRVSLADAPAEPDETILPQTEWTIPLEPEDMVQWQQQQ
jgi:transglutaminase-like putative cysteine protease